MFCVPYLCWNRQGLFANLPKKDFTKFVRDVNSKVTVNEHDNAFDELNPVISTYNILDHANFPGVLRIRICLKIVHE